MLTAQRIHEITARVPEKLRPSGMRYVTDYDIIGPCWCDEKYGQMSDTRAAEVWIGRLTVEAAARHEAIYSIPAGGGSPARVTVENYDVYGDRPYDEALLMALCAWAETVEVGK